MDGMANTTLLSNDPEDLTRQDVLPLEPVTVYLDRDRLTAGNTSKLALWVHKLLAKEIFYEHRILGSNQFPEIAWKEVYATLLEVPLMFGIWSSKQVLDLAATSCILALRHHNKEGEEPEELPRPNVPVLSRCN